MSIESQLKRDGIVAIEKLDESTIDNIALYVSEKISEAYSDYGFTKEDLFDEITTIPMFIANIPQGFSEASYFYKNQSIYFRDGIGFNAMKKFAIHECIHHLQEVRDDKGQIQKMGLYDFNAKPCGEALNEAAVQIISSNILESTYEQVTYFGVTFSTISPDYYPMLCNLVNQMAYITGENLLYKSTFSGSNTFKDAFVEKCGIKAFNKIINNLEKILKYEEIIVHDQNKLFEKDLKDSKVEKYNKRINYNKDLIKKIYFDTQELILTSYYDNTLKAINTKDAADSFRSSLFNYKELMGITDNYYFIENYYVDMMKKIDMKFDNIDASTYLVPHKESKFIKILNFIKNIFSKKSNTEEINK